MATYCNGQILNSFNHNYYSSNLPRQHDPNPVVINPVAIVYENGYQGAYKYIFEGENDPNLNVCGWNDRISSIKLLDDNIKVTFYDDCYYSGNTTILSTRYSSQYVAPEFNNDAISSYTVERITRNNIVGRVWSDGNYQGAYRDIFLYNENGTWANVPFPNPACWNDRISSMQIFINYGLHIYEHGNYAGGYRFISGGTSISFLGSIGFNDVISSWIPDLLYN